MDNKLLSQEEIDALLKAGTEEESQHLDDVEIDALGEIGNIAMGTAATTLSMLLGQEVKITTPKVLVTTEEDLRKNYPHPYVLLEVGFIQGLQGTNLLVVQEKDAILISELMMGGSALPADVDKLDEMRLSAVGEAMNQMMGSSATAISTVFDKRISISPPNIHYINLAESELAAVNGKQPLVQISFKMTIGALADSEIMQILPLDFAKEMVATLVGSMTESPSNAKNESKAISSTDMSLSTEQPVQEQQITASAKSAEEIVMIAPHGKEKETITGTPQREEKVVVQPVAFAPLMDEQPSPAENNLELLLDIPLEVTVELGRTKRLIKDVLELGVGSVIELDKLAGEPVDVVVNGKLVARGEVVVIDENFGVRITDILTQVERVKQLQ